MANLNPSTAFCRQMSSTKSREMANQADTAKTTNRFENLRL